MDLQQPLNTVQNMLKRPQISFPSLFFFFCFLIYPVMANKCSKADQNLADLYQNYYAPAEAHAWIQNTKIIMDKDLSDISLVRGELKNGPKEIYCPENLQKYLMTVGETSPCRRGTLLAAGSWFMLGNGLVYYEY